MDDYLGIGPLRANCLGQDIAGRWVKLNSDVFARTGKLMEKYNVVDTHLQAGGGNMVARTDLAGQTEFYSHL